LEGFNMPDEKKLKPPEAGPDAPAAALNEEPMPRGEGDVAETVGARSE
jgi:hypothetical protein